MNQLDKSDAPDTSLNVGRRKFLKGMAGVAGVGLLSRFQGSVLAQENQGADAFRAAGQLGAPVSEYGKRSQFDTSVRWFAESMTPEAASSRTPLQDGYGIMTPPPLHYERHHGGVPTIDPHEYQLMIHGLVDRPIKFTLDDLKRFPAVSRIHFLECSGNSGSEWRNADPNSTVQTIHGLTSTSEWTGVPLSTLLREVGVKGSAKWLVAEGADAPAMTRSVPLEKAWDDVIVAYGQNGAPLMPEQGFPVRLFVPGWEGNISIKWLRRIQIADKPSYTREETSKYTDLMPDGTARQFTWVMDAKSVITRPSGGQVLPGKGFHEITGIAWSGRGRIARVEVTMDGGRTWQLAELQQPVLPISHTRFRFPWRWDGTETVIASRTTDELGYVQPTRDALIKRRGTNSVYHYNGIQAWHIASDGVVTNIHV